MGPGARLAHPPPHVGMGQRGQPSAGRTGLLTPRARSQGATGRASTSTTSTAAVPVVTTAGRTSRRCARRTTPAARCATRAATATPDASGRRGWSAALPTPRAGGVPIS